MDGLLTKVTFGGSGAAILIGSLPSDLVPFLTDMGRMVAVWILVAISSITLWRKFKNKKE